MALLEFIPLINLFPATLLDIAPLLLFTIPVLAMNSYAMDIDSPFNRSRKVRITSE